jgi:glycosyltransferase involved in cell wall biosynthesis
MRVVILTANAQAGDGIGNQVAEKLAFFRDRGADVRVFAESHQRLHPFVQPFCSTLDPLKAAGESWDFLAAADLVIVEYGQSYALLDLLPLLAGTKARLLFDYYGVTPPHLWGPLNREGLEIAVQHRGLVWCADTALTHSRFTQRELLEYSHFPLDRCVRLPLPVDTDRFCPGLPEHSFRARLGLTKATLLLFVGRLAVNKRVPMLVEALARLRDLTPPVHALIVGDTGDLYQLETRHCQDRAAALSVADRVHFLGHLSDDHLRDAYRSADVLVMPSVHEGFCLPVLEAMACGLPVVAARAGALPETVGGAGLTFIPDDPDDLARQLRRVLPGRPGDKVTRWQGNDVTPNPSDLTLSPCHLVTLSPCPLRVAVVACRYGTNLVGGAETSLRTMAEALHQTGHQVEVFTTCVRAEANWTDDLPEGTREVAGIPVHRFRLSHQDPLRYREAMSAILQADGKVPAEVEEMFLQHSFRSSRLIEALGQRINSFDAVITGPYLFGLPFEVVRAWPEQTLLMPCFHEEPLARLRAWVQVYGQVGGMLYHSPEEQFFAETELGLNLPGGVCIGTVLDMEPQGDGHRGQHRVGSAGRYLVYGGRYLAEKGLPTLLDYVRRYEEAHPGRFTLALMGLGDLAIPRASWVRDLGFVEESVKRDVLAGAAALAQFSRYESLSLVALEAWAQGVPVLADAGCAVLVGHLRRGGGGQAVNSYETFAAALDDLWARPQKWQTLGRQGQEYVGARYGSRQIYTATLEKAIRDLPLPLAERMRRRGLERAAEHARPVWRERFAALVEDLLDHPARSHCEQIEVRPRTDTRTVSAGAGTILVPVRVGNQGTQAALAHGPARVMLQSEVADAAGQAGAHPKAEAPLPALVMPGQTLAAALPVQVPATPGTYQVLFSATRRGAPGPLNYSSRESDRLRLIATEAPRSSPEGCCMPLLAAVQTVLVEAHRRQRLPDSYLDVTQGWFASWKAWLKRKLLGNFKHAYVDVLSHQQSAFNQQVLNVLQELTECCAILDSSRKLDHSSLASSVEQLLAAGQAESLAARLRGLLDQVAEDRRQLHALHERIVQLEQRSRPQRLPTVSERFPAGDGAGRQPGGKL